MTVIRGLSPLVRLRDFSFWRMKVRVTGGFAFFAQRNVFPGRYSWHSAKYSDARMYSGMHEVLLPEVFNGFLEIGPGNPAYISNIQPIACVVNSHGDVSLFASPLTDPFSRVYAVSIDTSVSMITLVSLLYDPLPDVLSRLDWFGQRLEVWLETEISGGSREWRRLFRSKPAAQVSIVPLQDAGFVDEDGYIVRMPESGWLPVFGRNALGPYSQIDQFNPSQSS